MMKNQAGRYSIARVFAVITFVLWIFTWLYTLLLGKTYAHMETVSLCMLIFVFSIILNKSVESKIITIKGDDKK